MKKVLLAFLLLFALSFSVTSCEAETIDDEQIQQTDPEENCPPNDTNCNGIPDNQE